MTTIPFALSIHKFVNSVGADVGFASIFAVAILVLLYFAHARETATLRDRLDEAYQRIGGLEARIAQLLQAQAAAQRGRAPGVTPAPVAPAPVRPMGSAISSVRRVPTPAVAVAGGAAAGAARAVASGMAPAAPVGMAAPALASATKLIPDAETFSANGAPDDTLFVPAPAVAAATAAAATAAAGNGHSRSERPAPLTEATQAIPAVAAAAARTPGASPRGAVAAPPRVQMGAESGAAGSATAAGVVGGAATAAAAAGGSRRPTPPQRFLPPTGGEPKRSRGRFARLSGRVLPLLIGGIAVVVVIVGLVIIINTGGSSNTPVNHNGGNSPTGQKVSNQQHHPKAPPFNASKVTVAVLNGTAVSGLAGDVSTKLAGHGYHKGNATNAASQTQSSSVVYYITGANAAANKTAAQHVAKALTLPLSRVRPATQTAIQSCSISATGAALNSCGADVIVSVGSDRANLASGSSSG